MVLTMRPIQGSWRPRTKAVGASFSSFIAFFNVDQCDLPQAVVDKLPKIESRQHEPIEAAERIMASMPNAPEIQYAGSKAFYSSITDRITLPCRELNHCQRTLRHRLS